MMSADEVQEKLESAGLVLKDKKRNGSDMTPVTRSGLSPVKL
jgi:hypothetical protein